MKNNKTAAPQHNCPSEGCDGRLRRIKGSKGFFWGCTNFKAGCKETRPDSKGKPARAAKAKGKAAPGARKTSQPAKVGDSCPECKKGTIAQKTLKTGKNAGKSFKACTNYPQCRYFAWPDSNQSKATPA
jgi:DNA topoisomerase-3